MWGIADSISSRQYYPSDSNWDFNPIGFSLGHSTLSLSNLAAYVVASMVTYAVTQVVFHMVAYEVVYLVVYVVACTVAYAGVYNGEQSKLPFWPFMK